MMDEKEIKKEKLSEETPYFYLNWKCKKCGDEYGNEPDYCYGCGSTKFKRIEPKQCRI